MGPADFLTTLWGPTPPGLIQIWELASKRSTYYRAPAGTQVLAGRTDAYTAVSTAHKDHGRNHRAKSDQALAVAGLWLDLDVNGPHKRGGIPTREDALELSRAFTAPTIVVDSGYGLHAWYLFDRPWRFTSRAEQDAGALASAQFYALHRQAIADRGWGLDSTHDLARLLRIPGTFNGKGETPLPVEVLHADGPRHDRTTLLQLAAQAGDVAVNTPRQLQLDGTIPDVRTPAGGEPPAKLAALLANVPEFAAAWNHQLGPRAATWSLSEYDLSIAGIAAQSPGITDQDLADLIAHHRRLYGDDAKASRLDYLQRTIAKVRTPSERSTAIEQLHARHAQTLRNAA